MTGLSSATWPPARRPHGSRSRQRAPADEDDAVRLAGHEQLRVHQVGTSCARVEGCPERAELHVAAGIDPGQEYHTRVEVDAPGVTPPELVHVAGDQDPVACLNQLEQRPVLGVEKAEVTHSHGFVAALARQFGQDRRQVLVDEEAQGSGVRPRRRPGGLPSGWPWPTACRPGRGEDQGCVELLLAEAVIGLELGPVDAALEGGSDRADQHPSPPEGGCAGLDLAILDDMRERGLEPDETAADRGRDAGQVDAERQGRVRHVDLAQLGDRSVLELPLEIPAQLRPRGGADVPGHQVVGRDQEDAGSADLPDPVAPRDERSTETAPIDGPVDDRGPEAGYVGGLRLREGVQHQSFPGVGMIDGVRRRRMQALYCTNGGVRCVWRDGPRSTPPDGCGVAGQASCG